MKRIFLLKGLDCPNCSAKIEKEVGELDGVQSSVVNLMKQTLTINVAPVAANTIASQIETIVHSHEPDVEVSEIAQEYYIPAKKQDTNTSYNNEDKKLTIRLAIGAAIYGIGMALTVFAQVPLPVELVFLIVSYIILGGDVVWQAVRNISKGRVFDEHFLMSVSTIGAFVIGEYPEAVAVMLFYQVGEFFQSLAVEHSRKSISDLNFGTNMKDGSIGKISENRFARADLEHILLCVDDDMRMEALRQTNYVKSIVTAQGKMDLERKGKQSYQGWMFARLLAFSNGDLQALYDRSDGFYRRQLVLTTKEKPMDRADDPDLAEKMKAEAEGIFLWAFEGLQRLVANNFKFTESDRIRKNREAVKRDNNNIFDFMESEGYIRLKADASISSKDFYEIYRMWCEENSLAPLKARSFSDAMIANAGRFNLEHCNNITNSAGRRVWGFMGVEAVARPHINGFYDVSPCTYVPEDWRD